MDCWKDVFGLDMSPLGEQLAVQLFQTPMVDFVTPDQFLSTPLTLTDFDCHNVTEEELRTISGQMAFVAEKQGDCAGVAVWFDCIFDGGQEGTQVNLSTAPGMPHTHWKQSVVLLGSFFAVTPGDDLSLQLTVEQDAENPRHYRLSIQT